MSGISSGVGIISGINSSQLIDQLIAIERQPIDNLKTRVTALDTQRAAFLELSAQLLAVQNSVIGLGKSSFFRRFNAPSSNESVLSATADEHAVPGTYSFRVRSLVSTHSVLSRGFADADRTPVGTGSLTIEVGGGQVSRGTELDTLNGGAGVRRGIITITDRSGASSDIDLSTAITVEDVLQAINADPKLHVRASVTSAAVNGRSGDRIVIEDLTPTAQVTGDLIIADRAGGSTAASLGIVASTPDARVDGLDLVRLSKSTPLSLLNDGNGVGALRTGSDLTFSTSDGDFTVSLSGILALQTNTDLRALNGGNGVRLGVVRLTDRSGKSADVDLSAARTVQDVLDTINASGVGVRASVVNSSLRLDDTTETPDLPEGAEGPAPTLKVEDVSGFAAADLGVAATSTTTAIAGREVYRVVTVGDLLNAINYAPGNVSLVDASVSPDGDGITLRALGLDATVTVTGTDGSTAAHDLGLTDATFTGDAPFATRRLVAGLNTSLLSSLRGGRGVGAGTVRFTDAGGASADIDFTGVQTLQDVIDRINADGRTSFVASVNSAGHGIALRDESGVRTGQPLVEDLSGTLAADLGIAWSVNTPTPLTGNVIDGGNAQLKYVSRQTLLADLNAGRGVSDGTFQITDTNGRTFTVTIDSSVTTIGAVIDAINLAAPDTIEARINDTGDGIVVLDTAGGKSKLAIADRDGGQAAADLRLAGEAAAGASSIDGSFETRIDVGARDTLQEVATKINAAAGDFSAAVLNHGGALNPFSLTITSGVSGRRGALVIDSVGLDLGLTTLSRGRDAVVTLGDGESAGSLVISSPTNTLSGVVPGVTLNLLSASNEPVSVSVARDVDGMVESIKGFVQSYNKVLDTIGTDTKYDQETNKSGPLFGDSTVELIRSRLNSVMLRPFGGSGPSFSRLFTVGIRSGQGGKLTFDEERFRDAFAEHPEKVEELFTNADSGFAAVVKNTLDDLTRNFDGLISRRSDVLTRQQDLVNERIDALNLLLEAKRRRLEVQFAGLESSLAALQGQQNALTSLQAQQGTTG